MRTGGDVGFFTRDPSRGHQTSLIAAIAKRQSAAIRNDLSRYISLRECPACHGARLMKESLSVTVAGRNIHEICPDVHPGVSGLLRVGSTDALRNLVPRKS